MSQVFISHSSEDADFASQLATALREAGVAVWISTDSIRPGESFVEAIERGLSETTHFLLVMSPHALDSRWVKLEMNTAIRRELEGHLSIVPVEYKPCKRPLLLGTYQWLIYEGDIAPILDSVLEWVGADNGDSVPTRHWAEPRNLTDEERERIVAELGEITEQVRACTLCALANERLNAVPGDGPPGARIMMVGEAPGPEDDQTGIPFVSAAGEFLDELLGLINLPRKYVYMTNIVKCRPNQNRDPERAEVAACAPYLQRQIDLLQPKAIITLGAHATRTFIPGAKLSEIHGQPQRREGRLIVPMYHPAAALYRSRYRTVLMKDFLEIEKLLANGGMG